MSKTTMLNRSQIGITLRPMQQFLYRLSYPRCFYTFPRSLANYIPLPQLLLPNALPKLILLLILSLGS